MFVDQGAPGPMGPKSNAGPAGRDGIPGMDGLLGAAGHVIVIPVRFYCLLAKSFTKWKLNCQIMIG